MPKLRGGARSASRQKNHTGLEASVTGVTAADDNPRDSHAASPQARAAPFDGEDDIGHQFQSEREIENRAEVLKPAAATLPEETISAQTHRGILPAEGGSLAMHKVGEHAQLTD